MESISDKTERNDKFVSKGGDGEEIFVWGNLVNSDIIF